MAGNSSAIDNMNPVVRGRRKPAAPVVRGRRVAPVEDAAVETPTADAIDQATADLTSTASPAPKKRGPKPGSKRKPREPRAASADTGGFDFSQVSRGLKAQLRELKAKAKAEDKEYRAESKALQKELGKLSARMEALEKQHAKRSTGYETGIAKIEATLASLG